MIIEIYGKIRYNDSIAGCNEIISWGNAMAVVLDDRGNEIHS